MPYLLVLILCLLLTISAKAAEPDWTDYTTLLSRHVSQGEIDRIRLAVVDYAALRRDPLWPRVVRQLAAFSPGRLASREERLAFYINAYNILAIKMVIDHWPVDSIKDAGGLFSSVWKKQAGVIGGEEISLDGIEHGILRPMREPRVHMAIVCASVSCPDLASRPYTAATLHAQLEAQARAFLYNSGKGIRLTTKGAYVSRIFDWFEEDFRRIGGVMAFIRRYRDDVAGDMRLLGHLAYDWRLNLKH